MLGKPNATPLLDRDTRFFSPKDSKDVGEIPRQDRVMADTRLLPLLAILNFALIL